MTSTTLKTIAIITMVIDHVGLLFFPQVFMFRLIGRISFPIFAFLIVNGVVHTSNFNKYILRLSVFALISQIPFYLMTQAVGSPGMTLNIFFTLLLGAVLLRQYTRVKNIYLSAIATIGVFLLATYVNIDYGFYGIMLIISFYIFKKSAPIGVLALLLSTIYYYTVPGGSDLQMFALLAVPIIALYKDGEVMSKRYRTLLYWFYPVHICILLMIRYFIA